MEYPKTIEEATDQLQGYWTTENENGDLSFAIDGLKIVGMEGAKETGTFDSIPDMDFSIALDPNTTQWRLFNPFLFGAGANIIEWDEDSFTVSLSDSGIERRFIQA